MQCKYYAEIKTISVPKYQKYKNKVVEGECYCKTHLKLYKKFKYTLSKDFMYGSGQILKKDEEYCGMPHTSDSVLLYLPYKQNVVVPLDYIIAHRNCGCSK